MKTPDERKLYQKRQYLPQTAGWILLALAAGPQHGGEIKELVVADTVGGYIPSTTFYRLLERLIKDGYIEPIADTEVFRLTPYGRDYVRKLAAGWARLGQLASSRLR